MKKPFVISERPFFSPTHSIASKTTMMRWFTIAFTFLVLCLHPATRLFGQSGELSRIKDSLGIELIGIKRGKVTIGATSMDDFLEITKDLELEEERMDVLAILPPLREIEIKQDYWIGTCEVTISQFRTFVDSTGYVTDAEESGEGGTGRFEGGSFGQSPSFNWKNCGITLSDNHPVVNVSWNDATEFCKWMSKKEGVTYRLPTELEWEHACRAGSKTQFHTGNEVNSLKGYANIADRSLVAEIPQVRWAADFDDGFPFLAEVGKLKPNRLGIHDMHGNAGEWCMDRFSFFQPLGKEPASDSNLRLLKGGHWFGDPTQCGSAVRVGMPQNHAMSLIGFRVVRIANP
jgi:formylglycine-generating enzyme